MIAPEHSLTERLAKHSLRDVDDVTAGKARLHLLDWLGCVAGGLRSELAGKLRALDDRPVLRAAWLGNLLEMDDVHRTAILHPGPVVWPVALLDAERMDAMLTAAVRGYEAMIAVGATFDRFHYARWHNTATAGGFGAAAAAASLRGCDAEQTTDALGLAGSVAGGLWRMRHEAVDAKQWHVFHAARTGVDAARAAAAGVTGPRAVLEGVQGLYAAMAEAPGPVDLADGWRIDQVSFKPWGACRHAHPAIDAALDLRERGALNGEVLVETYRDALTFCDRPDPTSVIEAKFSVQHAIAIVTARGEPRLEDFEPAAIAALAPQRALVTVREDPGLTSRFPDHYGARVSANGEAVERRDTLGDPDRPLDAARVVAKARALMHWGGVGGDADQVVALCLTGDDPAAIRQVVERWL